jgi:dipicolinate synthase subunit A
MKDNTFLILGGDNRSLYLGEYLENQGFKVCYYAFNHTECYNSLEEAMNSSDVIVLPLPFTKDRLTLNTPLFDDKVVISDIVALLFNKKMVFGGQLPKSFCEELESRDCPCCDYFLLDELAIYNAVPTAEGVVQVLIEELPITIHGMKCAVLGYGRVGKILANTLRSLGADVTVFARKESAFAEIHASSMEYRHFDSLVTEYNDFDAMINTVPVKVLGEPQLSKLNSDCVLIEVASAPFGIDFQFAKERAFKVVKAGSLPGKVAPKTAGEIIGNAINKIIKEENRE